MWRGLTLSESTLSRPGKPWTTNSLGANCLSPLSLGPVPGSANPGDPLDVLWECWPNGPTPSRPHKATPWMSSGSAGPTLPHHPDLTRRPPGCPLGVLAQRSHTIQTSQGDPLDVLWECWPNGPTPSRPHKATPWMSSGSAGPTLPHHPDLTRRPPGCPLGVLAQRSHTIQTSQGDPLDVLWECWPNAPTPSRPHKATPWMSSGSAGQTLPHHPDLTRRPPGCPLGVLAQRSHTIQTSQGDPLDVLWECWPNTPTPSRPHKATPWMSSGSAGPTLPHHPDLTRRPPGCPLGVLAQRSHTIQTSQGDPLDVLWECWPNAPTPSRPHKATPWMSSGSAGPTLPHHPDLTRRHPGCPLGVLAQRSHTIQTSQGDPLDVLWECWPNAPTPSRPHKATPWMSSGSAGPTLPHHPDLTRRPPGCPLGVLAQRSHTIQISQGDTLDVLWECWPNAPTPSRSHKATPWMSSGSAGPTLPHHPDLTRRPPGCPLGVLAQRSHTIQISQGDPLDVLWECWPNTPTPSRPHKATPWMSSGSAGPTLPHHPDLTRRPPGCPLGVLAQHSHTSHPLDVLWECWPNQTSQGDPLDVLWECWPNTPTSPSRPHKATPWMSSGSAGPTMSHTIQMSSHKAGTPPGCPLGVLAQRPTPSRPHKATPWMSSGSAGPTLPHHPDLTRRPPGCPLGVLAQRSHTIQTSQGDPLDVLWECWPNAPTPSRPHKATPWMSSGSAGPTLPHHPDLTRRPPGCPLGVLAQRSHTIQTSQGDPLDVLWECWPNAPTPSRPHKATPWMSSGSAGPTLPHHPDLTRRPPGCPLGVLAQRSHTIQISQGDPLDVLWECWPNAPTPSRPHKATPWMSSGSAGPTVPHHPDLTRRPPGCPLGVLAQRSHTIQTSQGDPLDVLWECWPNAPTPSRPHKATPWMSSGSAGPTLPHHPDLTRRPPGCPLTRRPPGCPLGVLAQRSHTIQTSQGDPLDVLWECWPNGPTPSRPHKATPWMSSGSAGPTLPHHPDLTRRPPGCPLGVLAQRSHTIQTSQGDPLDVLWECWPNAPTPSRPHKATPWMSSGSAGPTLPHHPDLTRRPPGCPLGVLAQRSHTIQTSQGDPLDVLWECWPNAPTPSRPHKATPWMSSGSASQGDPLDVLWECWPNAPTPSRPHKATPWMSSGSAGPTLPHHPDLTRRPPGCPLGVLAQRSTPSRPHKATPWMSSGSAGPTLPHHPDLTRRPPGCPLGVLAQRSHTIQTSQGDPLDVLWECWPNGPTPSRPHKATPWMSSGSAGPTLPHHPDLTRRPPGCPLGVLAQRSHTIQISQGDTLDVLWECWPNAPTPSRPHKATPWMSSGSAGPTLPHHPDLTRRHPGCPLGVLAQRSHTIQTSQGDPLDVLWECWPNTPTPSRPHKATPWMSSGSAGPTLPHHPDLTRRPPGCPLGVLAQRSHTIQTSQGDPLDVLWECWPNAPTPSRPHKATPWMSSGSAGPTVPHHPDLTRRPPGCPLGVLAQRSHTIQTSQGDPLDVLWECWPNGPTPSRPHKATPWMSSGSAGPTLPHHPDLTRRPPGCPLGVLAQRSHTIQTSQGDPLDVLWECWPNGPTPSRPHKATPWMSSGSAGPTVPHHPDLTRRPPGCPLGVLAQRSHTIQTSQGDPLDVLWECWPNTPTPSRPHKATPWMSSGSAGPTLPHHPDLTRRPPGCPLGVLAQRSHTIQTSQDHGGSLGRLLSSVMPV